MPPAASCPYCRKGSNVHHGAVNALPSNNCCTAVLVKQVAGSAPAACFACFVDGMQGHPTPACKAAHARNAVLAHCTALCCMDPQCGNSPVLSTATEARLAAASNLSAARGTCRARCHAKPRHQNEHHVTHSSHSIKSKPSWLLPATSQRAALAFNTLAGTPCVTSKCDQHARHGWHYTTAAHAWCSLKDSSMV
jgi:hypothetical protein